MQIRKLKVKGRKKFIYLFKIYLFNLLFIYFKGGKEDNDEMVNFTLEIMFKLFRQGGISNLSFPFSTPKILTTLKWNQHINYQLIRLPSIASLPDSLIQPF